MSADRRLAIGLTFRAMVDATFWSPAAEAWAHPAEGSCDASSLDAVMARLHAVVCRARARRHEWRSVEVT